MIKFTEYNRVEPNSAESERILSSINEPYRLLPNIKNKKNH